MNNARFGLFLAALAIGNSASAQWSAYHGVTAAYHQSRFTALAKAGYRMTSLAMAGSAGNGRRYSAVWRRQSGPAWTAFHGMSIGSFQAYYNARTRSGYNPTILTVSGYGSNATIAGVFEKDGIPTVTRHGLTAKAFDDMCGWAHDAGYILTGGAIYGTSFVSRHVGIWKKNVRKLDWAHSTLDSASQFQNRFRAYASYGVRPHFVTLSNYQRYMAIWHDDSWGPYAARHGLTSSAYQVSFNSFARAGYWPLCVHAGGSGSSARYAAIFVKRTTPLPRRFTTTGTSVPALTNLDFYVRSLMFNNNVRGASLAVVKNAKLVLARGYTYAEAGYPITQPTSLFRIASMAKPLTSIAVHQAIEQNKLTYATKPKTFLGVGFHKDFRFINTTLDHLLTHRGGWNIGSLGFDPMFRDEAVAKAQSRSLPITTADIFNYMTQKQLMQFAPGTQQHYSNYGFMIAGRMLERANPGYTYERIVQRDVFAPLGVTRARLGGTLIGQRAAGEVRYHPSRPYVKASIMSSSRPWVAGQYGFFNMRNHGANGGWIMSAPDYAKVLAAFDLREYNPLLCEDTVDDMFTIVDSKWSSLLRGWWLAWFKDDKNVTRRVVQHNGGLAGTSTVGFRRADGLSMVLFLNRDISGGLHAGTNGKALNDLANKVRSWPTHDLFPSVGLPRLQIPCAKLTLKIKSSVPNVSSQYFELVGQHLQGVSSVLFGSRTITAQSENLERGWFVKIGKKRIRVYPPQGMTPGTRLLRVRNARCISNGLTVSIVRTPARVLRLPARASVGRPFALFASRGPSSSSSQMWLAFSDSSRGSSLPGLITLGIGDRFKRLYLWPFSVRPGPATGAARWDAPTPAGARGATIHFQTIVADARAPLPLPVTNRGAVKIQ